MGSALYYFLVLLFTLIYIVPFTLLFLVTVLFDKERAALHWASRIWAVSIYRCCPRWHVRVEGLEHLDRARPSVIVTNHQAMLDIPLMYVLPVNFKWVSKKEVQKIPIFGQVLYMHGDITVKRGSAASAKRMMQQAQEHLSRGTSVIIFPEGTRTKTGRIGPFKDGAFKLAAQAGVALQPVVHEGNGSAFDGWRLRAPHQFTVRVLEPVPAGVVAAIEPKALAAEVEAMMVAEHRRMRPDLYPDEGAQND